MPKVHPLIAPLVYAVPVQLLAYHTPASKAPMSTSRATSRSRSPSNKYGTAEFFCSRCVALRCPNHWRATPARDGQSLRLADLPLRLSPLQILGLRIPRGRLGALRALQYAEIHTCAAAIGSQALAARLRFAVRGRDPGWILGAWFAALVAALWNQTRIDRRLPTSTSAG
jgi:hypothetical protein